MLISYRNRSVNALIKLDKLLLKRMKKNSCKIHKKIKEGGDRHCDYDTERLDTVSFEKN